MNDDQWEAELARLRAIEAAARAFMGETPTSEDYAALRLALNAPRWYTPKEREIVVNCARQETKIQVLGAARDRVQMALGPHWRNLTSDAQDELALLYYVTSRLRGFDT